MITIQVNDNGEVTLSQETPGERIVMSQHYATQDGEAAGLTQTQLDEAQAEWFKQGWQACSNETKLWYVQGRIEEFFQTQGAQEGPDEGPLSPEDMTVDWDESTADTIPVRINGHEVEVVTDRDQMPPEAIAALEEGLPPVIADDPAIQPAPDSGEPELEDPDAGWEHDSAGNWVMSTEELQSRLDEAHRQGVEDGRKELTTVTTERALTIIASELDHKLFPSGTQGMTRGEVFRTFAIELAKRLGWTVDK